MKKANPYGPLAGLLLALASGQALAAPCDPRSTGPIVDVHFHVYSDGAVPISGRADPFTRLPEPPRTGKEHLGSSIDEMMGWPAEISEAVAAARDAPFLTAERSMTSSSTMR